MLCMTSSVMSQAYDVEWGELERSNGRLIYALPNTSGSFYALRWTGGRLLGSYRVSRHEDMNQVARGRISVQANGSISTFEGARVIGGKLVAFLSDRRGDKSVFYMQEYSTSLEKEGDAIQLASYDVDKFVDRGWFDIVQSADEKFFAVVWEIPGKKDEHDRYGFKIFNTDRETINEGEYRLPYASDLSTIQNHHISNHGEYFLSVTEYERTNRSGIFRNNLDFKAVHLLHIADDGLQDFTLDFDGQRIEAMAVSTAVEGFFTVTGLYGPNDVAGVKGVFYQRVNLETREVITEGFKEFDKNFITADWSDRQLDRAERRQQRGKGEPQLYNYIMREAQILDDGSIVGTMEQYYVQISTVSGGQSGQVNNIYHYYYNDIIAYKINPSGDFEWITKINKFQVSTNDGGPYSSYESFFDDGKLYFIFNDNSSNYDEAGNFKNPSQIYAATYSRKRNVVALASIDLESGASERKSFFDRSEIGALVVPKLFDVNYNTGEMLMYAIWGTKEKFGLLKFKN